VKVDDARAFLKRSQEQYDLILFGLLDSHTQLSDYSNMRIDNFVYTKESFEEARRLLKKDGVLFVKFQVNYPWMAKRLEQILRTTFHKEPIAFYADSSYSVPASCFAVSSGTRIEDALGNDLKLRSFVDRNQIRLSDGSVEIPTDDWPYLYQQRRGMPRAYY